MIYRFKKTPEIPGFFLVAFFRTNRKSRLHAIALPLLYNQHFDFAVYKKNFV